MEIFVSSNFELTGLPGDRLELPDGSSLRSFLESLGKQVRLDLIDSRKADSISSDFAILLNGQEHFLWPQGLQTPLHEADKVQIQVIPLAGG